MDDAGPLADRLYVPLNLVPMEQAGQDRSNKATAESLSGLIKNAAERMVMKECKAAERMATKHADDPVAFEADLGQVLRKL